MTDIDRREAREDDSFADAFDGPTGDDPDAYVQEVPAADATAADKSAPDPFASAFNGPTDTTTGGYVGEVPPAGPDGTDRGRPAGSGEQESGD